MNPTTMHVKPAREGLIVLEPSTKQALPPEGKEVPRTTYWLRRLRSGDVVEVPAKAAKPTSTK
jgi:hypothetical protein